MPTRTAGFDLSNSQTVGTTPVQLLPAGTTAGTTVRKYRSYLRIFNISVANGPTLWITRQAGLTPGANVPGCIPILPGSFEEFRQPAAVPSNGVMGVATAAGCAVTVEIG